MSAPPLIRTPSTAIEVATRVQIAVDEYNETALAAIKHLHEANRHTLDRPTALEGCIFVGHTATDMDSIGSSIGAAELFNGTAAAASAINSETDFALKEFGLTCPPPFPEVLAAKGPKHPICLVDHNQISQIAPGVDMRSIRGVIDHHALQSGTIVTDLPIYVNIRPWGSACTIVTHMFVQQHRIISKSTAGALLAGILSDTLNLNSPTTTEADKMMVSLLAKLAGVENIDSLAHRMFKAKSRDLSSLSAHGLVRGDFKVFKFTQVDGLVISVGFGVVETVDPECVLDRLDELLLELRASRKEEKVDMSFLAVVDIVRLHATLLIAGEAEKMLAERAFGGKTDQKGLLNLGNRVSRKKDYMPPLSVTISEGWIMPPRTPRATPHLSPARQASLVASPLNLVRAALQSPKLTAPVPSPATAAGPAKLYIESPSESKQIILCDEEEEEEEQFGEVYVDCTNSGCILKRRRVDEPSSARSPSAVFSPTMSSASLTSPASAPASSRSLFNKDHVHHDGCSHHIFKEMVSPTLDIQTVPYPQQMEQERKSNAAPSNSAPTA